MANNIPGIVGYVQPNAFSRLIFTASGVGNPAGVRNVGIIGLGQREEYLVYHASGNGTDGIAVTTTLENNYNALSIGIGVSAPNGLVYQTSKFPIVTNQLTLFKNGKALLRSRSTVVSDTVPRFESGTDYAVDFATGKILLAPARVSVSTNNTDGFFEYLSVPANVPSETWTITAIAQPDVRGTIFSVTGSKSGQIFGAETFTEQRNTIYSAGPSIANGGIFYYDNNGNKKAVPASSYVVSDPTAYYGTVVVAPTTGAVTRGGNIIQDATKNFQALGVKAGYFIEFLDNGNPNFGQLFEIAAVGVDEGNGMDYSKLQIVGSSLVNYGAAAYTIVTTRDVGQNYYTRPLTVYGANKLTSSRKRYFIRIIGSLPTDLTADHPKVYLSPGQALYATSDDYSYNPITHEWSGTWYAGADGTGLVTNEVTGNLPGSASGRAAAVPIYTSAGVDSGLLVNFAMPTGIADFEDFTAYYDALYNTIPTTTETAVATTADGTIVETPNGIIKTFTIAPVGGWGPNQGYIQGSLTVKVNGVEVAVAEPTPPSAEFVNQTFTLAVAPLAGDTITATYTVGDLSVARQTGFRVGDIWMIEADGKYDNGKISFSLFSGENPFRVGDSLSVTVTSSSLEAGDTLVAGYVCEDDLNDPEEFFDPASLYAKHGYPSTTNTLALGAQIAFANGAKSVVALQARPTSPLRTRENLLASRASELFVGNGGIYFTAHTHGGQNLGGDPQDQGANRSHTLMHAVDYGNAMTTLHRHNDGTNYINPSKDSPALYLFLSDTPYQDDMHFFITTAASTTPRQIFLNKVPRTLVTDVISMPCSRNFGTECNLEAVAANPYFLDSTSPYYLTVFPTGNTWDGYGVPSMPAVFTYPDAVRNTYSNDGRFPIPDTTAYDWSTNLASKKPCGSLFRLRNGFSINGSGVTTTTVDGLPLSAYTDQELAFKATCSDSYDSVLGTFLQLRYNGGSLDPNDLNIEDAKLYMHTQRTDMSYMVWTSGEIILSDRAGLNAGEGLAVSFVTVDDAPFVDAEWSAAAAALEAADAYWIVPLPTDHISAVQQTFKTHVETMSSTSNKKERQLLTGAFYGTTDAGVEIPLLPQNLYAGATNQLALEDIGVLEGIQAGMLGEDVANYGVPENFGTSYRTMYFYPDKITVDIAGVNYSVPGFYLAAAAAGYLSSQGNIAEPLTWKNLIGFNIPRDRNLLVNNPTIANKLGAAGVVVVQGLAAGGKVLHAKTTIQGGSPWQEEPTSVNIADLIAKEVRDDLGNRFIGRAQTQELPHEMLRVVKSNLQSAMERKLISNFDAIQISQDSVEPRQYNVSFQIAPVLPLLWIYCEISVGI
jgi:hypothetical protein